MFISPSMDITRCHHIFLRCQGEISEESHYFPFSLLPMPVVQCPTSILTVFKNSLHIICVVPKLCPTLYRNLWIISIKLRIICIDANANDKKTVVWPRYPIYLSLQPSRLNDQRHEHPADPSLWWNKCPELCHLETTENKWISAIRRYVKKMLFVSPQSIHHFVRLAPVCWRCHLHIR